MQDNTVTAGADRVTDPDRTAVDIEAVAGNATRRRGEAKRLLAALAAEAGTDDAGAARSGYFSMHEIMAVADRIMLNVPDLEAFIHRLNEAGELLMHGRLFKLAPGAGGAPLPPLQRGWDAR